MREIKFRAWDKKNKKMISHEKLFSIDCSNEFPFLPLLKNMYSENLDVEIMQYAGVHDSTGKEVYEGDIVRTSDNDDELAVVEWDDEDLRFTVTHGNVVNGLGEEYYSREVEVVGNIYDDPELLGGDASD